MDHARSSCIFLVVTSRISFGISLKFFKWLAMAEILPSYSFGSIGVKIMLCECFASIKFDL